MRTPIVAGNWKMNGNKASIEVLLQAFISEVSNVSSKVVVCAPYPYLSQVQSVLEGSSTVALGAQNVSQFDAGAYTGETSISMLSDFGCQYVIVGHSERRERFGDTDKVVAEKFSAVMKAGLTPILCVGETLQQRQAGKTLEVVERQLMAVLEQVGVDGFDGAVVAYEPVWAIGTGLTATPDQAQEVHLALRERMCRSDQQMGQRTAILYGGSVKAASAKTLFECADIDGGLVGGASLDPKEFIAICQAAG